MAASILTSAVTAITSASAVSGGTISGMEGNFRPITHRLLINKFQLYKACCQKLSGSIRDTNILRPFMLFEDSKQSDKKFILTSYAYRPMTDSYEDVSLSEYDNTTDMSINIIT